MTIKKKICFVNLANPNFLGGLSLYQRNLIKELNKEKYEMTWLYKSYNHEKYEKDGVNYVGIKVKKIPFLDDFVFNYKVKNYLKNNYFDIINSHAVCGQWMRCYKKGGIQKIIHTYHGLGVPYYKILLKRFNFFTRFLLSLVFIPMGYVTDRPPMRKADKIICVSEKVKNQIEETYFKRKEVYVIRTGVDTSRFKPINKESAKKKIRLNPKITYGLYVGKGGYWIKGLDRTIKLCQEIYNLNKNFRLIVLGSDYKKVSKFLNKDFIIYKKEAGRDEINYYYSSSDMFFCLSRYDGGAPTLVVSEAMASGCMLVTSKDAKQEIIKDKYNGIIISEFDKKNAEYILSVLTDKSLKNRMILNSINTIKKLSVKKWSQQIKKILD